MGPFKECTIERFPHVTTLFDVDGDVIFEAPPHWADIDIEQVYRLVARFFEKGHQAGANWKAREIRLALNIQQEGKS